MVLKSDEGKGKTWVAAKPEHEWNVESGFWERVAWGADLFWCGRFARAIDGSERWISDEGKLSSVTNHLVVPALLFAGKSKLAPDLHPVTVLSVDALTTDFNFNLSDELVTGAIKPSGVNITARAVPHSLVDFWESYLEVSSVGKITVSGDGAGYTATEIGLTVESLLNRFNGKIGISAVCNFPECDLRIACKIDVLCAVSD